MEHSPKPAQEQQLSPYELMGEAFAQVNQEVAEGRFKDASIAVAIGDENEHLATLSGNDQNYLKAAPDQAKKFEQMQGRGAYNKEFKRVKGQLEENIKTEINDRYGDIEDFWQSPQVPETHGPVDGGHEPVEPETPPESPPEVSPTTPEAPSVSPTSVKKIHQSTAQKIAEKYPGKPKKQIRKLDEELTKTEATIEQLLDKGRSSELIVAQARARDLLSNIARLEGWTAEEHQAAIGQLEKTILAPEQKTRRSIKQRITGVYTDSDLYKHVNKIGPTKEGKLQAAEAAKKAEAAKNTLESRAAKAARGASADVIKLGVHPTGDTSSEEDLELRRELSQRTWEALKEKADVAGHPKKLAEVETEKILIASDISGALDHARAVWAKGEVDEFESIKDRTLEHFAELQSLNGWDDDELSNRLDKLREKFEKITAPAKDKTKAPAANPVEAAPEPEEEKQAIIDIVGDLYKDARSAWGSGDIDTYLEAKDQALETFAGLKTINGWDDDELSQRLINLDNRFFDITRPAKDKKVAPASKPAVVTAPEPSEEEYEEGEDFLKTLMASSKVFAIDAYKNGDQEALNARVGQVEEILTDLLNRQKEAEKAERAKIGAGWSDKDDERWASELDKQMTSFINEIEGDYRELSGKKSRARKARDMGGRALKYVGFGKN